MRSMGRSMGRSLGFTTKLIATLLALLLGYGLFAGALFRLEAEEARALLLQQTHRDLAAHIVSRWPQIAAATPAQAEREARESVLRMLRSVNPAVQVYVLDAQGRVEHYLGEPGMVQVHQVDLAVVRQFLAQAALPLRGTDPMGPAASAHAPTRLFSAAMFPPRNGEVQPPGYLYIVLDAQAGALPWRSGVGVAALGLALAALLGVFSFMRITRPLQRLAAQMRSFRADGSAPAGRHRGDEVQQLQRSLDGLVRRIDEQAAREAAQAAAHRETMAALAHDLRTPLTALHGQLEALASGAGAHDRGHRPGLLQAALAQSDKVRRLSQQLFELAALQAAAEVPQHERFRLDELVADSVSKFQLMAPSAQPVLLAGAAPGALEVLGDLQLVERAVTNLIDNARQHGAGPGPVRVHLGCSEGLAQIVVEDSGPGLPADVQARLVSGCSLRDPPLRRSGGGSGGSSGVGGLGLAIAQRVAQLHGGSLRPLPAPLGGTRLCLALPLAG